MKKTSLIIISLFLLTFAKAQLNNDALIFEAMKTELDRSMNGLRMQNMPNPFFINFIVSEGEYVNVLASLGSVISARHTPVFRSFFGRVLTESYDLTNDFLYNNQGTIQNTLTIDNDLEQLRRGIWIAADIDYKGGLEGLTSKKNALRRINLTEAEAALSDYEKITPVELIRHASFSKKTDLKELEILCEKLSKEFGKYQQLYGSRVQLIANQGVFYNLTSEGTKTKQPLSHVVMRFSARTRTDDGAVLSDYVDICVADLSKLPSERELLNTVNTFASELQAIRTAKAISEYYNGPVLFEGDAVADIFAQHLTAAGALVAYRKPVVGGSNQNIRNIPIGRKLIDTRFTVFNHTQMSEYNGKSLVGGYAVDGEGIVPEPTQLLVENGLLRSYLNNRIPTEFAKNSNGNSRIGSNPAFISTDVKPSVLEIQATDGLDNQVLRQRLLNSAKNEGLDYAYIVRKTSGVVKIYQVDVATGSETLMRSPDIENVSIKHLKRVDAVSSEIHIANRLLSNAHDNSARGQSFPISIISPNALLLQDIEINSSTATLEVKPSVKNPLERP
jgi:hypothetical protein